VNTPEAFLDAGAVLSASVPVTKDDAVDTLTARTYRHPALDDRVVVRLVPATLGEAEDLALEFLAFGAPERVDEVGLVRQQALGFPAWALVHDPANGHHALALVKDIERLARAAKSRVGPANDGFIALGEQLARTVPHFLPTFYEQAGRAFLAADSPSYAATMFGRAREAERAYGLTIDEERTHAVFLEFALAGALTAKALSAHARDLTARCLPPVAYERFRKLCVERTLGGLPPYAGMHTDLRRLAKASGLEQVSADGLVLADILAAPAILRAPAAFWTAYQGSLAKHATRDKALRTTLFGLFPDNCPDEAWLALLEESGAVAALVDGGGPADGAAGWLSRFAAHRDKRSWRDTARSPGLVALVPRLAPRLIADGEPVVLCGEDMDVDLDLLDACLATGVPVADPHSDARWSVARWIADETDGRRDIVAVAADDRFRSRLAAALEDSLDSEHRPERVAAILAVPGLREALHGWLDTVAETVVRQGLPTLRRQLDRMALAASPDGFAVNPEAVRRVVDHDLGPVVGRTLRCGVLDEYGWPAWEDAVTKLLSVKAKDDDEGKLSMVRQWPVLLARRGDLVLAIGAERIELEHETRIPKAQRHYLWRLALRYVDGALLVCWDKGRDRAGYWTSEPDDVFVVPDDAFEIHDGGSLAMPEGGRTYGGAALRAGDRSEKRVGAVASDGTTFWVLTSGKGRTSSDEDVWREFDPATGQLGPVSMPGFFVEGGAVEADECWLRPAVGVPDGSPLGQRDGLVGWRVRHLHDRGRAGEGIDGRTFTVPGEARRHGQLAGAFRFPGSDETYGLLWSPSWRSESVTVCASDGFVVGRYKLGASRPKFARGTGIVPPAMFWSYLRPRDPGGSAALRVLTDERASALLAGAAGLDRAGVRELVVRELPELTHPALVDGVAGVVQQAAKRVATLRDFASVLSGQPVFPKPKKGEGPAEPVAAGHLEAASDDQLYDALGSFMTYCIRRGHSGIQMFEAAATALTAVTPPAGKWAHGRTDTDWYELFGVLPVAMYLAILPATATEQREALLVLLDTYARSGLGAPGGRLRMVTLEAKKEPDLEPGAVLQVEGRRLLVRSVDDQDVMALDYAPDGQFGPIPGFKITDEDEMELPLGAGELVRLVRENGPAQWDPELATRLSEAAGMSRAEAVFLLAGLPTEGKVDVGLSAALLEVAQSAWREHGRFPAVLGLLMPEDPAALWSTGPRLDLVVAQRVQRHGQRRPVPDELIELAHRAGLTVPVSAAELLHGLANPDTCRWLQPGDESVGLGDVVVGVAQAVAWLGYHLPPDHPIRANLPGAVERVRQRLRDPASVVDVGYVDEEKVPRIVAAFGGTPTTGPKWIEVGPVRIEATDEYRTVQVRPGLLSGPDDPALAVLRTRLDDTEEQFFGALRALDKSVHNIQSTVDAPHDPSRSAPELVAAVASARGLGADAATLYLQLLALPDPTDRNVARWTGWKPARLAAARKELAATDLVVEAKRSRAGRSLFLPGGWLALRSPHLPVERWKIPLLTLDDDGGCALDIVVPAAPLPELFALAWQRVADGDIPKFDEITTPERRR
jgi:hypothetical protein